MPDSFTDGKWIGSAMGHDDDLFVQVTVAGGDIAGISVLRCDDTIGIGSTAAPMMQRGFSKPRTSTWTQSPVPPPHRWPCKAL